MKMDSYCRCGKVYCRTEAGVRALRRRVVEEFNDPYEVRFYECEYKGWHWTRQLTPPAAKAPKFVPVGRTCADCPTTFTATREGQLYCSKTCKRRARARREKQRKAGQ